MLTTIILNSGISGLSIQCDRDEDERTFFACLQGRHAREVVLNATNWPEALKEAHKHWEAWLKLWFPGVDPSFLTAHAVERY